MEPWGVTAPTSGAMETFCASVEVQVRRADSPLLTEVLSAAIVTVGFTVEGGGVKVPVVFAGGFLEQPAIEKAAPQMKKNRTRKNGRYA